MRTASSSSRHNRWSYRTGKRSLRRPRCISSAGNGDMAGQQSAGFDLVMEYSEDPLQDALGVALDTNDFLCSFLQLLGIPCEGFRLSVSLDRPTDPVLTPARPTPSTFRSAGGSS